MKMLGKVQFNVLKSFYMKGKNTFGGGGVNSLNFEQRVKLKVIKQLIVDFPTVFPHCLWELLI